jgi:hypothetical protein
MNTHREPIPGPSLPEALAAQYGPAPKIKGAVTIAAIAQLIADDLFGHTPVLRAERIEQILEMHKGTFK